MTALQSTCSCSQNQAQAELSTKINDVICKLTTLRDLGELFMEDDALCVPACVIKDYTILSLALLEELEEMLSTAFSGSICRFPSYAAFDDCPAGDQP